MMQWGDNCDGDDGDDDGDDESLVVEERRRKDVGCVSPCKGNGSEYEKVGRQNIRHGGKRREDGTNKHHHIQCNP